MTRLGTYREIPVFGLAMGETWPAEAIVLAEGHAYPDAVDTIDALEREIGKRRSDDREISMVVLAPGQAKALEADLRRRLQP